MHICCLDLEGVLVPEVWIRVARKTGVRDLELTTRDISDYDVLMQHRLKVMKREGIRLKDIQRVISTIRPLPGALSFIKKLRSQTQVIILSDTFYEFAEPLMRQLDFPTLFCHYLKVNKAGFITGYTLRQKDAKRKAVETLRKLRFEVRAAGDSYNDISMLQAADKGILFSPPDIIRKEFPKFPATKSYAALLKQLLK